MAWVFDWHGQDSRATGPLDVACTVTQTYVGMIKSKSGLNVYGGIVCEGVIDAGYTGSIKVKLYNLEGYNTVFKPGAKIAQLVILPIVTPAPKLVDEFAKTERGDNGFGSTGR